MSCKANQYSPSSHKMFSTNARHSFQHDLRHAIAKITKVAFPCRAQRWLLQNPELEHFWAHLYESCDPHANATVGVPTELVSVADHFVDLHDPVYNFYQHGAVWTEGDPKEEDYFDDEHHKPVKVMPLPESVIRQVGRCRHV